MENTIPDWLKIGVSELKQVENQLTTSRTEMFKALDLYYTHVKYVITLMFSLLTALFAILGFAEKLGNQLITLQTIKILVGTTLITMSPLALCAICIIRRYYGVYISSLIFAVRVHLAAELHTAHPWFNSTIAQAIKWQNSVKNDEQFVHKRTVLPKDTFFLYASIIVLVSLLSLFCGVLILFRIS